uniref:Beta-defensin n=1 Tax=Catagonus wagneri TaxID=51154 RepID=A0A8C3WGP8_9CETA
GSLTDIDTLFSFLFVLGSAEKCWNLHGSCRDKCSKNEKVYVFCMSGKLCCVKPNFNSLHRWFPLFRV